MTTITKYTTNFNIDELGNCGTIFMLRPNDRITKISVSGFPHHEEISSLLIETELIFLSHSLGYVIDPKNCKIRFLKHHLTLLELFHQDKLKDEFFAGKDMPIRIKIKYLEDAIFRTAYENVNLIPDLVCTFFVVDKNEEIERPKKIVVSI